MNERTKSVLKTVLAAIFFIICVALVVLGQKNVGPSEGSVSSFQSGAFSTGASYGSGNLP